MITIETAKDMIRANRFEMTAFVCDDGTTVNVRPCYYTSTVSDFNQIDYYLVYGDLPWLGGRTLEEVLEQINNHSKLVNEQHESERQIRAYFDKHQREGWDAESYSEYSDWHKDVYGYRPHFDWRRGV